LVCYLSTYDKVNLYETLLIISGKNVKHIIKNLWHSRLISIAILSLSIIGFSYLFFSPQSVPNNIPHSDKYGHIIVFFCLSILIYKCINIAKRYQITLIVGYGAAVEGIQHFISYRSGGIDDLIADIIGVVLFYLLTLIPACRKLLK